MPIHILFAGQNFHFMDSIIERLENNPSFLVKMDKWQGHHQHDEQQSRELLEWADVIVCNWMLGNAVWYSHHKLPRQKLLIRYHRFEITTHYPKQLNLKNVDLVISTSAIFQPQIERYISLPKSKSMVMFNPIDVRKFCLDKHPGSQFRIGMVGYNRKLKGLHRTITIWEHLVKMDPRYTLLLKGFKPQEITWIWRTPEEREYFQEQFKRIETSPYKDNVIFQPYGRDVPHFLQEIGFIISASDFESFHCAAAEGMASGSVPLIMGWTGADTIYPNQYIFNDDVEAATFVHQLNQQPELMANKQWEVQRYAKDKFDIEVIYPQFVELISQ